MEQLIIEFDGGSRGNPGPAGTGTVVRAADGTPLVTLGRFIGRSTNNVAEYQALITGLEEARKLGGRRIAIRGDSELIIKQIRGEYRVKHPDLVPLHAKARTLLQEFDGWSIDHNVRDKNKLADQLANLAMDRRCEVTECDEESVEAPAPQEQRTGDRHACPRCGCVIEIKTATQVRAHQLRDFVCQCGMKMGRV